MSANVWLEEVNAGMLRELRTHVKIKSSTGELIELPDPDNSFVVRKPDEDFKFEVFPCVSVYIKDYRHDPFRYNPIPIVQEIDPENKVLVVEDQAVPFNLSCQIDFWSEYQEDMDNMTRTWLMHHFRQFNLPVIDDGGTERTVNVLASGSIVKSDLVLNKERLFHSIANYTIWVEVDDEVRYNVPMVATVDIDAKQKQ